MSETIPDNTDSQAKLEEEMTAEELAALQKDEDFIANFKDEDLTDPDKAAELTKALASAKTTVHQKRHFREKAKTLEAAGKPKPGEPAVPPVTPKPEENKGIDPVVALTFRQDNPGLTKEVANEVLKHAAAYKISPEEALKSPIIAKFVKDSQVQEDVEEASVPPSRRSGGSAADRDWSNATPAEMEEQRRKILYPNG